ncbi:hypothetical protein GCM10025331_32670 [Actinoplanes utahensis]|nr:hypothetical protein Aut01nite_48720 [Actinoplanes utahensis]
MAELPDEPTAEPPNDGPGPAEEPAGPAAEGPGDAGPDEVGSGEAGAGESAMPQRYGSGTTFRIRSAAQCAKAFSPVNFCPIDS